MQGQSGYRIRHNDGPDVLHLDKIVTSSIEKNQMIVEIKAVRINHLDFKVGP